MQYIKYECGHVITWGQRAPKYGLIVTMDYKDRRDMSVSIFKTESDLRYYVKQEIINQVMAYKILDIYSRPNRWHEDLMSWPYVKYHVQQYDC